MSDFVRRKVNYNSNKLGANLVEEIAEFSIVYIQIPRFRRRSTVAR